VRRAHSARFLLLKLSGLQFFYFGKILRATALTVRPAKSPLTVSLVGVAEFANWIDRCTQANGEMTAAGIVEASQGQNFSSKSSPAVRG
jgi:hypothetical protein